MRCFLITASVFLCCVPCRGTIMGGENVTLDFTKEKDSKTLELGEGLKVTQEGLGIDDESHGLNSSFTTAPMAVGTAWRTVSELSLTGTLKFSSPTGKGKKWNSYMKQVYVRYGPDKKHWSTWQPLLPNVLQIDFSPKPSKRFPDRPKIEGGVFEFFGDLEVPGIEGKDYARLLSEYEQLDVPWINDEEAAVKWMLKKHPDFFSQHLPFIGYIQFRFEGSFAAGVWITGFNYSTLWSVGGMRQAPKDPEAYKKSKGPWRFDATVPAEKQ